jgi:hypothetical protein
VDVAQSLVYTRFNGVDVAQSLVYTFLMGWMLLNLYFTHVFNGVDVAQSLVYTRF